MTENTLTFPPDFMWGTATAAYQIEGSTTADGRVDSIWDRFSATPGKVLNGDTGAVACDHYKRFREDVDLIASLNTKHYRFSIAWPRIHTWHVQPDGSVDLKENAAGIAFYNSLIDALLEKGIAPLVTLYHWDLPQPAEEIYGGWRGDKEICNVFARYAETCFRNFGDRVKMWITLNEPWCSSYLGYEKGEHAPGMTSAPGVDLYLAAHNLLIAHAKAVDLYRRQFQAEQQGKIGITLNTCWFEPSDHDDPKSVAAAETSVLFELGWFAHPVHFGNYPEVMRKEIGERLPRFTTEESGLLKNSSDFFGLNHYSTQLTGGFTDAAQRAAMETGYYKDKPALDHQDDSERSDMDWPIVPWGFRKLLEYIQKTYANPGGIIVTENGLASKEPSLEVAMDNPQRVRFYREYLKEMHAAMNGPGKADVRGYFLWSLMDNFEWAFGYSKRFGLHYVDYETLKRTPKPAALWYAEMVKRNALTL